MSIGTATALNPHLGYLAATEIAVLALTTGRSVRELAQDTGLVTEEELSDILSPRNLAMIRAKIHWSPLPHRADPPRDGQLADESTITPAED